MMAEVIAWGLKPSTVTGDSWYGKIKTLTTLKTRSGGFSSLQPNRSVALEHGKYVQVQSLDIPEDGLIVYLKKVGGSRYLGRYSKRIHYAVSRPTETELLVIGWENSK
jgi:hypothetical protein